MVCSGHRGQGPRPPRQVQHGLDGRPLRARGQGSGGWYRNIAFVPSYNDAGKSAAQLEGAPRAGGRSVRRVVGATGRRPPTSGSDQGGPTGGAGAPYDFAVLHVTPEKGSGKSLEETVGSALPVEFDAPAVREGRRASRATGYPAAPPFDGQKMFQCIGQAGPAVAEAARPDDVPHRLHHDRRFLRRRLGRRGRRTASRRWSPTPRSARPRRAGWPGPRLGRRRRASTTPSASKFEQARQ